MTESSRTDPRPAPAAGTALSIGLGATAVTWLAAAHSGLHQVATAWLLGLFFWTGMAIGMLMLILIHHIFDAMWSTVLRRQFEHAVAAFKWLALLFAPLILISWFGQRDVVWPWMNPRHVLPTGEVVGSDMSWVKKAGFLNIRAFSLCTAVIFGIWIWLSARVRKASFAQDADGDPKWTLKNRWSAGLGIPLLALSLTLAAIYWVKSLEYHWFSTIYGVWYFADCMRGAYSLGVLIMCWLLARGDYKGIIHTNHWHSIGQMMLAFTVFWGYAAFAQYFLIWNADVPEEVFWYNIREYGDWWWIGMVLVFCHFLLPFLWLLSYRYKVTPHIIRRIAVWILALIFIDFCWNIIPALTDARGHPVPFLSLELVWSITATIGVGGICLWAYLRSFGTAKLIPIRDPRIEECLVHHE